MTRRYWDEQLEALAQERRLLLREHRLRWQVRRCWDGSPFYRSRLEAAGLDPATFGGSTDWPRFAIIRNSDLPGTTLLDAGTESWAVAPSAWWQRPTAGSAPWRRVLTDGDLMQRADLAARALWAAGARAGEPLGISTAADSSRLREAMADGATRIGADLRPDAPIAAIWATSWPPPHDSTSPTLGAVALPFVAPTAAYACGQSDGVHWADDHLLVEIVDAVTGDPVAPGTTGTVVVTDLTREGSPLLRYWTGVEAALAPEPCPCGRTSARSPFVRLLV